MDKVLLFGDRYKWLIMGAVAALVGYVGYNMAHDAGYVEATEDLAGAISDTTEALEIVNGMVSAPILKATDEA
jgi:FMN phosphatase YigB (HAD superfamily)